MKTLTIGTVQPKQWLFMTDKHRHIAYGGARGGGKSWAVRAKGKLLALRYPGIKILIVRRTMPELRNNHIDQLRTELKGFAKYNQTEKIFRFPNGSSIAFGYCAKDNDLYQYQGAEYDVIFIDEAAQLREEWIKKINACVRGANGFPKRTYYTLNPGGPSHGYFKRLFVDRIFNPDEYPEDYSFIQAKVTDNKALLREQPDYIRSLENLPPKLRAAWLDGRWDVYEGQFFEDFVNNPDGYQTRQGTHVIDPFEIPSGWTICRSYDFGYGKPFSCAWWAVDYDGVIYRILELYGCTQTPNEGVKWTPDKQFAEIAKIERQHPWLKGKDRQYGTRAAARASSRQRHGTACISQRATTSASRAGCNAITGCNSTRTAIHGCMYSATARRLSARSRFWYTTSTRLKISTRAWRIMWRTNGGTSA